MHNARAVTLLGVEMLNTTYAKLLHYIHDAVNARGSITIGYATAHTLNLAQANAALKAALDGFTVVHPDGAGVYGAARFLFGGQGFDERITGSDFYPLLIDFGIEKKWRFFIFGDEDATLNRIRQQYPAMRIAGMCNGFTTNPAAAAQEASASGADVLLVGTGQPRQELWIAEWKGSVGVPAIIAVGEGLKVLAGTKVRGPRLLRALGLEWLARLFTNFKKFWRRYLLGIPLFMLRILVQKYR